MAAATDSNRTVTGTTTPLPRENWSPQQADVHTLRVVAGMDMLRYTTLEEGCPVEIGRGEECDLALHHDSVSRRHARVERTGKSVELVDLRSTNPTTVNGEVVERAVLGVGDRILVGSVSVRYELLTHEELEHLSLIVERVQASGHDPLTGLRTRHRLDDRFHKIMEGARSRDQPASCLFLDVDRFKEINDTHGHLVGDEVLSSVAKLIHIAVRRNDHCVRYGGDEILILVEDTDESRIKLIGERILSTVKSHDWGATQPGLKVTASGGVAQWDGVESAKQWLDRADRSLRAAKKVGRGRILRASKLPRDVG